MVVRFFVAERKRALFANAEKPQSTAHIVVSLDVGRIGPEDAPANGGFTPVSGNRMSLASDWRGTLGLATGSPVLNHEY
jgi:hypothetical protein